MLIIRCICTTYWLLLTILLLVPDPLGLLGIRSISAARVGVGTHFLVFAVLGVLVSASRWGDVFHAPPTGRMRLQVLLVGLLIGYATATELLQSFVPPRSTSPEDLLENLLGLAAGTSIWWVAKKRLSRKPRRRQ